MNRQLIQLLKFGLVGGVNTAIDFGVFALLTACLGWPYLPAQCIAFLSGVLNSYAMNRSWTFRARTTSVRATFYKFGCLNLLLLLWTSGIIALLHQGAGWPLLTSKLAANAVSVCVNFAGSRLWVFRTQSSLRKELTR